jgi:branched-chain amino acid transport system permease protein
MIGILASIVDGVLVGSVYGLAAMGLTLIWGVMRVINLAHGAIIVLGMFLLYFLVTALNLPAYGAIPITAGLCFVFGVALYWVALHRVIGQPELMSLLATFAVNMILIGLGTALWSTSPYNVPVRVPGIRVEGYTFTGTHITAAVIAGLIAGLLYLLLHHTRIGKAVRAVASNRDAAQLVRGLSTQELCGDGTGRAWQPGWRAAWWHRTRNDRRTRDAIHAGGLGADRRIRAIRILLDGLSPRHFRIFKGLIPVWRRPFPWIITSLALLFALVPYAMDDVQLRESLILAAVYIVLASNLNLMIGYAGYVNFGNIVFFGLGGYLCLFLVNNWRWGVVSASLASGISVSALALLFGLGILRLRGAFFALATIGVNAAIQQLVTNFEPWGGATGIYLSLDAYGPLGGPMQALWTVYLLVIAATLASLLSSYAIKRSKFGLGLLAIGQNESAAAVLGVPTPLYKALVYSASAFLPAVVGGLYFYKTGIIEPNGAFSLSLSIEAIVMVMLGGQGTVVGPALGAFVYEEMRRVLLTAAGFSSFQLVIAGALLLTIVLFVPGGLIGYVHRRWPQTQKALE